MIKTFDQAIETKDPVFESIFEIMKIGRRDNHDIDSERNFLLVVNLIIDYYISRGDNSLKIPVIYFPTCNENSQELCEEFVTLKLGLFTNKEWRENEHERLAIVKRRGWFIRSDETSPQIKKLSKAHFDYEKALEAILSHNINTIDSTSLLYSNYILNSFKQYQDAQRKYNRKTVNKYWYLARAINGNYSSQNECPLSLIAEEAKTFYDLIIKIGKDNVKKIENLVFFPCNSPDGDYSEFCNRIVQKSYLDNFVNAGSGLRNVFIFRFSRKPYRLRRLLDTKNMMKEKLGIHTNDDCFDFISFNYDEAALLFYHTKPAICNLSIGKSLDDSHQDFVPLFNDIIDSLENKYILRRNEVAMCVNEEMTQRSSDILTSEAEIDETILAQIFAINRELWSQHTTLLTHFLDESNVCVIVGNNIDEILQSQFSNWLMQQFNVKDVQFASFGDLKGKLINGKYRNNIQSKRIIVLSFRNDYTESIFHKYPNSFDPICINEDQKAISISNLFTLKPYYDWGYFNYTNALKKVLKSQFRGKNMTLMVDNLERPHKPLEDYDDEDSERNYKQVQQATIIYSDSSRKSFNRSEWMLYQYKNEECAILPLSDLADLYSDSTEGLSVQPISYLINVITNEYLEKKKAEDTKSEKLFKEQPIYGLTKEEISNNIQLWKLLLQKKIEESSIEDVYKEFSSHFSIKFSTFSQWPNESYGLLRDNKMQEYLIRDYLGIKDPYLKLVRRLKAKSRNNTEAINASIRHFLSIALLSDNYKESYRSLKDEQKDLLSIESADDIEALIGLVSEKIYLEPIKSISL